MRAVAAVCLVLVGAAAAAGCSLIFDGDALLPDAATGDLAVAGEPDDLSMPPEQDLPAPAPPDLTPPCVPGVFAGDFGDGGVFDCPCGCTLDPFTAAPSAARWSTSMNAGWNIAAGGGTLEFVHANVSNGDGAQLTSSYQLSGDFELRIDFNLVSAPNGGRALMTAYGPLNGAGTAFVPTFYADVYSNGTILRGQTIVDDNVHDFSGVGQTGTVRLRRTGTMTCAAILGVDEDCRADPEPLVHWYINVSEANQACLLCGTLDARFMNARLVFGRLVPP